MTHLYFLQRTDQRQKIQKSHQANAQRLQTMDNRATTDKTPAPNSGLAKVAVQCSYDSFVVQQTVVLRINICSKNRHLRQAAKR
ncbi:MAG: hypothetical protein LC115_05510 [Bacteroidia bacterium]|nr:hypothetical protein [Bacteroidia bacterium]